MITLYLAVSATVIVAALIGLMLSGKHVRRGIIWMRDE